MAGVPVWSHAAGNAGVGVPTACVDVASDSYARVALELDHLLFLNEMNTIYPIIGDMEEDSVQDSALDMGSRALPQ